MGRKLLTLMFISMRANLRYEWEKRVEVKYPKGQCVAYDSDGTCGAGKNQRERIERQRST